MDHFARSFIHLCTFFSSFFQCGLHHSCAALSPITITHDPPPNEMSAEPRAAAAARDPPGRRVAREDFEAKLARKLKEKRQKRRGFKKSRARIADASGIGKENKSDGRGGAAAAEGRHPQAEPEGIKYVVTASARTKPYRRREPEGRTGLAGTRREAKARHHPRRSESLPPNREAEAEISEEKWRRRAEEKRRERSAKKSSRGQDGVPGDREGHEAAAAPSAARGRKSASFNGGVPGQAPTREKTSASFHGDADRRSRRLEEICRVNAAREISRADTVKDARGTCQRWRREREEEGRRKPASFHGEGQASPARGRKAASFQGATAIATRGQAQERARINAAEDAFEERMARLHLRSRRDARAEARSHATVREGARPPRASSARARPGERTSLKDPSVGRLVKRDPSTGELLPERLNSCPSQGSWRCANCTYVNRPAGVDAGLPVCRVCQKPHSELRAGAVPVAPARRRESALVGGWRELEDVLDRTASVSPRCAKAKSSSFHGQRKEEARVCRAKAASFHSEGARIRRKVSPGAREDEDFYNAPVRVLTGKPRRRDDRRRSQRREVYRRTLIQNEGYSTTF